MNKAVFVNFFVVCNNLLLEWAKENATENGQLEKLLLLANQVDDRQISLDHFRRAAGLLTGKTADEVKAGIAEKVRINWLVMDFLRRLKADGYRPAILSNVNGDFILEILGEKKILDIFEHIFPSSDLKLTEPNQKIFRLVVKIMGCDHALLIDDNVKNVSGFITATGQYGIVFSGSIYSLENEFEAIKKCGF